MSQWECNAARLASALFSLSESGAVWPTSETGPCVCGRDTDKDQAGWTLAQISERALRLYGHVLVSQEATDVSPCLSQLVVLVLVGELKVKVTVCYKEAHHIIWRLCV